MGLTLRCISLLTFFYRTAGCVQPKATIPAYLSWRQSPPYCLHERYQAADINRLMITGSVKIRIVDD